MENRSVSASRGLKTARNLVHDVHEVAWCLTGQARITIAGRPLKIDEDTALWIPALVVHAPCVPRETLVMRADIEMSVPGPTRVVQTMISPALREQLIICCQRGAYSLDEVARAENSIAEHFRLHQTTGFDPNNSLPALPTSAAALEVATTIIDNPSLSTSCADLARMVHISERTLRRHFKEETGISFTRWRNQVRVARAIPLLKGGHKVDSVASECGYTSTAAFRRVFREITGRLPSDYRC